jgi:hypothetical protein
MSDPSLCRLNERSKMVVTSPSLKGREKTLTADSSGVVTAWTAKTPVAVKVKIRWTVPEAGEGSFVNALLSWADVG